MHEPVLADLTTLGVGGAAARLLTATTTDELVAHTQTAWDDHEWLVLGGGSNVLVADSGFDGTVVLVRTSGVDADTDADGVTVRVAAGEPWDAFVATTVANGWTGLEALSGIPGTIGAAPVQNIGAYGVELSDVLTRVEFLDAATGERTWVPAAELALGYRTSTLKHGRRGVVLTVEFRLGTAGEHGVPVRYAQLAGSLGVDLGAFVEPTTVRDEVLRLRASKGMVLDADDRDTWSAGSFFTNPIVSAAFAETLPADAPRWPAGDDVKLSAAWLIEHAGVHRGYAVPGSRAAISSKHTLALTNRGGATAAQVAELARYVQVTVLNRFGVSLVPEPVVVGDLLD
ncbi:MULTISPECIES: UDP-N-acetylmuramate dehydrogenase [unclassified Curtobacterium]|uniref:UDP-N-acetylmuramate dehydrogenase n=1 Tax=unclassified Curtobacterium TaxID=257496 RepID=UPI000F496FDE|nr:MULTISPECIES: UDP-N-acetylmuramate dehydrogenase [unclassified Curtobacterium]ROQ07025.1 UDP-N-acetylmuramate dehydrogenase [Curtobacterium sp. PhB171]ROQ27951.1 UDP-N-acetylmuramate dehydrogenase [Curtobacterium sp. PhB170]ROS34881.1 UDP-N-acetylmuramate dehydrogenase [Curtobacterium sp. PhB131]ROS72752.1 UDP-N-acetylmuramate dehydrogenase [Curtobacterium sp. PhB141]